MSTSFIMVDDGYPEAEDYDTNYIVFDEADPQDYKRAVKEALETRSHEAAPAADPGSRGCDCIRWWSWACLLFRMGRRRNA